MGVHTFPKSICPKVNVIVRLEYGLADYDSAVHRVPWSTAERRELRNVPYPSVFELSDRPKNDR